MARGASGSVVGMRWPKLRVPRRKRLPEGSADRAAPEAAGARITDEGIHGTTQFIAWSDLRSVEYECGGWSLDDGVWVEPWVWFHGPGETFVTMRYEQLPEHAFGDLGRLPGFPLADFLQMRSDEDIGKRVAVWERPAAVADA